MCHITNNELIVWFLKGQIAQQKGCPINWVVVAAANTKVKALRLGTQMKPKGNISYVSDCLWPSQEAIDKGDVDQKEGKYVKFLNANMPLRKTNF